MKCYKTADGKFLKTTEGKFVGADGSDEFQVIEGSVASDNFRKIYVRAAITHNLLTVVFDISAVKDYTSTPYEIIAEVVLPQYVTEHLSGEAQLGFALQEVVVGNREQKIFYLQMVGNTLQFRNVESIAYRTDDTVRISYSFIL